jgi:hypothetical protein
LHGSIIGRAGGDDKKMNRQVKDRQEDGSQENFCPAVEMTLLNKTGSDLYVDGDCNSRAVGAESPKKEIMP